MEIIKTLKKLKNNEAVLTWSGGLDSTCLIAFMIEEYNVDIYPLFINRKQENYNSELMSIENFTNIFQKKYLKKFNNPLEVNAIIPPKEFITQFPDADNKKTHALRNSDIINQAVRYALILDLNIILVGSNIRDQGFGDNSIEYLEKKTDEIRIGTGNNDFEVIAPFQELKWSKKEMLVWCHNHEIPIEKSWSCWKGGPKHCGICSPCIRRKEAFKDAKIEDRTDYLS